MWRTQGRYNPKTGGSYAWLVRSNAFANFFYFYCMEDDFGPFLLKFSTYFPYTAKLCINGNEWAKRQAAKAGIGFEPLDNTFAAVDDVERLQRSVTAWQDLAGHHPGLDAGVGCVTPRNCSGQ